MIYDYTDNGIADAIVDTESADYKLRVDYILKHVWQHDPAVTQQIQEYVVSSMKVENGNPVPGSSYALKRANSLFQTSRYDAPVDCYLLQQSPEVALPEVCAMLGMPVPNPAPKFVVPASGPDPVGAPWPEHGTGVYHVSSQYAPGAWPQGSHFTKDLGDGLQTKLLRVVVVQSPATLTSPGVTLPAWLAVGE